MGKCAVCETVTPAIEDIAGLKTGLVVDVIVVVLIIRVMDMVVVVMSVVNIAIAVAVVLLVAGNEAIVGGVRAGARRVVHVRRRHWRKTERKGKQSGQVLK